MVKKENMSDRIIDFIFSGVWLLALYMVFLWYRAKKENERLDKGLQKDWERSDKLEEENFELREDNKELKKDNERLKELNQACMEKIIILKQ